MRLFGSIEEPAISRSRRRLRLAAFAALAGLLPSACAQATDIFDIQPAALDQPRINAFLAFGDQDPQSFEGTFNIQAFFDTGASGVLLSINTAGFLGVHEQVYTNGQRLIFRDVGVAGASEFFVSGPQQFTQGGPLLPMRMGLAPYHPNADVDRLETYQQVYNQVFHDVRAQVGPAFVESDPILGDLDVFGMPLMQGKVVVMDPRPVDTFADTMRTYVYNPGTPYDDANNTSNPGIPQTSRQVQLSYSDVSRFTETVTEFDRERVSPSLGPSLRSNPFIGPNPVLQLEPNPPVDNTPPVKITLGSFAAEGSFLLDTGAAASIISEQIAAELGVSYDPNAPEDNPRLLGTQGKRQFQLTIGGIGGTRKISGFFLDSMLLRTLQGNAANDNDPNHFRFLEAPVLVLDIAVEDPTTHQQLTLDGIFGMNYLVASAFVTESEPFPIIEDLTRGSFKFLTFDQPNGLLGLEYQERAPQSDLTWYGRVGLNEWRVGDNNWYEGFFPPDFGGVYSPYEDGYYVLFTDLVKDADDSVNIFIPEDVAPGEVVVATDFDVDYRFYGPGAITGFTGLTKQGSRTLRIETANTYEGLTSVQGGAVVFAVPQNIGDVNVHPGAMVRAETRQTFKELQVYENARVEVQAGGGNILDVTNVRVSGSGVIDLADNGMIVRADLFSLAERLLEVNNLVKQARNGGAWDGAGITSSSAALEPGNLTTLAVILNDDNTGTPFHTEFFGIPVDTDSILVKYAWVGDLNLDGLVDFDDYGIIDTNFLLAQQDPGLVLIYGDGDVNYDGRINSDDYKLMDHAYLKQSGGFPTGPPGAGAAVPEPGMLSLLAISIPLLARRRSRV